MDADKLLIADRSTLSVDAAWTVAPLDYELLTDFGPLPVVEYITEQPKLPTLPVSLVLNPGNLRLVDLAYAAWIEYNDHGRADKSVVIQGKSGSLNFSLNFGGVIMGGVVTLRIGAVVRSPNGQLSVIKNTFLSSIRGRNPSKEVIRNRLNSIELQVTAFRESSFRQFDADGQPLFGPPRGFGIMQIDTPPATSEQIWNWTANVDAGRALWELKARDAETYPSRVRAQGNPAARDFVAAELRLETYQRYNGGAYWKWDPIAQQWTKSPPNGYADASFELETEIQTGKTPPGWLTEPDA